MKDRDDDAKPPLRPGDLAARPTLFDAVPPPVPVLTTAAVRGAVIHWLNGADSSIKPIIDAAVALTFEESSQMTVATTYV